MTFRKVAYRFVCQIEFLGSSPAELFFFLLVQKPFGKRERLKETMTDAMESFGGER